MRAPVACMLDYRCFQTPGTTQSWLSAGYLQKPHSSAHSEPRGYSGSVVSIEKSPEPVIVNAFVVYPREGPSGTDVEMNPVEACVPPPVKGEFETSKCTWIGWVSDTSLQAKGAGDVGGTLGMFPVFAAISEM